MNKTANGSNFRFDSSSEICIPTKRKKTAFKFYRSSMISLVGILIYIFLAKLETIIYPTYTASSGA